MFLAATLHAHGGQYRGPGNVVPPTPGSGTSQVGTTGSSGSNGAGSSPSSSNSSGSGTSTSAPTGPTASVAARSGPRGAPLDDDLTRWEFWWEFGKDPYLRLREALYGPRGLTGAEDALLNPRLAHRARNIVRPADADIDRTAEVLVGLLHQARDRDTTSACLVALAKIGRDGASWKLCEELVPFLASNDQEMRETAAISLGIAGLMSDDTVQLLLSLARDTTVGQKASLHSSVNGRTRAFAGFALGLLLQRSRDLGLSRRIVGGLLELLDKPESRDLTTAVIESLALFPTTWEGAGAQVLRDSITEGLGKYYLRDLGPGEQLVQAHVPPALARQLARNTPAIDLWKARLAADLGAGMGDSATGNSSTGKVNPHIAQSCALALGALCDAWDTDKSPDAEYGRMLLRAYRDHRDQQVRSFALLSLGRMGGQMARNTLLQEFPKAGRALEQPWIGMALGVLSARELADARNTGRPVEPDPAVTTALREALQSSRNPNAQGGLAVALGLCQDTGSSDMLRELLRTNSKRDDVAGYLCIALGLMQDDLATGEVRALLRTSERRPQVLLQSARALGLLGDHSVVEELCHQIEDTEPSLMRLSAVASALGQIGDRRSLDPLIRMAQNDALTPLTRAFAVVALGSVCDKDPLPWNAAFASFTNYRAATETLTDGAAGILDIL